MSRALIVSGAGTAALLVILLLERLSLDRRLRRVPLRIAVTGTRGKSSVVRLLAGALREAGTPVLAKTTGSRAVLILPDGSERPVRRRGLPTVLEQKRVVRLAARLGARALVAEMMSVRRECLVAESGALIRPSLLVLTNARPDHVDLMGGTREDVADCLASAVPRGGTILVPEEEFLPVFETRAKTLGARLVRVPRDAASGGSPGSGPGGVLEPNIRLALAAARLLGVEDAVALRGIASANPDFGSLRAWDAPAAAFAQSLSFVNAFAANDPLSAQEVLDAVLLRPEYKELSPVGLLSLRRDRGDRTVLWAEAFEAGAFGRLARVAVLGGHAGAFVRRMNRRPGTGDRFLALPGGPPERIVSRLSALGPGPLLVIGMGNIGGAGAAIVELWERMGRPHGL